MGVLQQRREEGYIKENKGRTTGSRGWEKGEKDVSMCLRAADLEHADLAVMRGYSDLCPSGLASSCLEDRAEPAPAQGAFPEAQAGQAPSSVPTAHPCLCTRIPLT